MIACSGEQLRLYARDDKPHYNTYISKEVSEGFIGNIILESCLSDFYTSDKGTMGIKVQLTYVAMFDYLQFSILNSRLSKLTY